MAAPIDLRNDFDSVSLRRLAKRTGRDPDRLLVGYDATWQQAAWRTGTALQLPADHMVRKLGGMSRWALDGVV